MAGIANEDLIESAIARPYTGYYRPIASKTAALVQSVATNHGFSDGNKRTSVILMHTPLTKRGYKLVPLPTDKSLDDGVAEEMVLDVVNHRLDFDGLVAWFKARIGKR